MGALSDAMTVRFGADALRYAAVGTLGFYLVAALLGLLAVRPLRRDWWVEDGVTARGSP